MGQKQKDMNVTDVNGVASWTPQAPGATDLWPGDWVEVHVQNSFPADAAITTVWFYADEAETQLQGTWKADGSSSYAAFTVAAATAGASDRSVLKIQDAEQLGAGQQDAHYFKIEITASTGGPWVLDPELINRGGGR